MNPPRDAGIHTGRFAPSPTGVLHFGSLLAALASFLQARSQGSAWYLRIEDLDPQRAVPGAGDDIRRTLERFGLYWDGAVLFQSTRHAEHEAALDKLVSAGHTFPCACARRQALTGGIGVEGRIYAGTCRAGMPDGQRARRIRLRASNKCITFDDLVQGRYSQRLARDVGDFVLKLIGGHAAYQLAVVVDDAASGIQEVVRGADLLPSTPRQIYLQQLLELPRPRYLHLPVLIDRKGRKLSKRKQAPGLSLDNPARALNRALAYLGQVPPAAMASAPPEEILHWAIRHWRVERIPAAVTLAARRT